MFESERKTAIADIIKSNSEIDKELVKIKTAIHTLDKLGFNTEDIERALDSVGISFYKLKNIVKEKVEK